METEQKVFSKIFKGFKGMLAIWGGILYWAS
jgi:hypothetical protein